MVLWSNYILEKMKKCKTASDLQCLLLAKTQKMKNGCGSAVFFDFKKCKKCKTAADLQCVLLSKMKKRKTAPDLQSL